MVFCFVLFSIFLCLFGLLERHRLSILSLLLSHPACFGLSCKYLCVIVQGVCSTLINISKYPEMCRSNKRIIIFNIL